MRQDVIFFIPNPIADNLCDFISKFVIDLIKMLLCCCSRGGSDDNLITGLSFDDLENVKYLCYATEFSDFKSPYIARRKRFSLLTIIFGE